MSKLAETIRATLADTPLQFAELIDRHRDVPWRDFLTAWGEVRDLNVTRRDAIGRHYIEGGPAQAIAEATKAE